MKKMKAKQAAYYKSIVKKEKDEDKRTKRQSLRAQDWAKRPMPIETRKDQLMAELQVKGRWHFSFPALGQCHHLLEDEEFSRSVVRILSGFIHQNANNMELRQSRDYVTRVMNVLEDITASPVLCSAIVNSDIVFELNHHFMGAIGRNEVELAWTIMRILSQSFQNEQRTDALEIMAQSIIRKVAEVTEDRKRPENITSALWWLSRPFWSKLRYIPLRAHLILMEYLRDLQDRDDETLVYVISHIGPPILKVMAVEFPRIIARVEEFLASPIESFREAAIFFIQDRSIFVPSRLIPIFTIDQAEKFVDAILNSKSYRLRAAGLNTISNLLWMHRIDDDSKSYFLKNMDLFFREKDENEEKIESVTEDLLREVDNQERSLILNEGLSEAIKGFFKPQSSIVQLLRNL